MSRSTLANKEDITTLVHRFYDKVRADPVLGPVFNAHIHDWDTHLSIMVRFWSSLFLGSGEYSGTPMPKHVALPGLDAAMFRHWLTLFEQTTSELPNRAFGDEALKFAERIARSLWFGYQINNHPNAVPTELTHG